MTPVEIEALCLAHLDIPPRFARTLLRRIPPHDGLLEELVSSGNLGLVQAANLYHPDKGLFRIYAGRHVHGRMLDYLRSLDMVSRTERERGDHIVRRSVSWDVVAEPVDGEDDNMPRIPMQVTVPSEAASVENGIYVSSLLALLVPVHADIIRSQCLDERLQIDVAAEYGISAGRVCQIVKAGMATMRGDNES